MLPTNGSESNLDERKERALLWANINAPFEIMKFRLTYSGRLPAAGNNSTRAKEKWAIRKALHPQLAELWATHPVLKGFGITAHVVQPPQAPPLGVYRDDYAAQRWPTVPRNEGVTLTATFTTTTASLLHIEAISQPIIRAQSRFIPLVRGSLGFICGLDIIFMRREEPGSLVLQGGDLDNRLKTLFDGLRMPSADDMKIDQPEADPFYCLMEEDSLITDINVRTDRLLTMPGGDVHDVHLVIEVTIKLTRVEWTTLGFLGD